MRWLSWAGAMVALLLCSGSAHAASLPEIKLTDANKVPSCVTPERLTTYLTSHNAALEPRFREMARLYKSHGEALKVRWDYAFFHMLVETNFLTFKRANGTLGDVKPAQNNFAGLGATGRGESGESYPDVATGVLAHLQHVLLYAGDRIESPVAERTRKVQEWGVLTSWQRSLNRPVTFSDLTSKWAPKDAPVADAIERIARQFSEQSCRGLGLRDLVEWGLTAGPEHKDARPELAVDCSKAPKRVALVIGIADYQSVTKLSNPVNDAKALAVLLRNYCIGVQEVHDGDHAGLLVALSNFRVAVEGTEMALVYYAGHGIHYDGADILLPRNVTARCAPKNRAEALAGTIHIDEVMVAVKGARNRVIILDACRTASFPTCPSRGDDTVGFRGLNRIAEQQRGTLIATSTSAGGIAIDGPPGGHSPYNELLRKHLAARPQAYLHEVLFAANEELGSRPGGQTPGLFLASGVPPKVCLQGALCATAGEVQELARLRAENARLKAAQTLRAAPAPRPALSVPSQDTYTVQAGDTLHGISRRVGVPVAEIMRLNGMTSPTMRQGHVLRLREAPATGATGGPQGIAAVPPKAKPTLDAAGIRHFNERAERYIQQGDVASARLFLERAVASGDAGAMFALAETYDPNVVASWGVRGVKTDPAKAIELYEKALAGGLAAAQARLQALK